jgi:hypothetical protein
MADEPLAYLLEARDAAGQLAASVYVKPEDVRYTKKLYMEEGFDVSSTPVSELPEGVELA